MRGRDGIADYTTEAVRGLAPRRGVGGRCQRRRVRQHDQAEIYSKGQFKDVPYYREDVEKVAERTYRPGKR